MPRAYEVGQIRTDRGLFRDKGNLAYDPTHEDYNGGADPDGLRDSREAFRLADVDAAAEGASVRPSLGTYKIAASLTLSGGLVLDEGVVVEIPSGVTLTINGPFRAGLYQCFDVSGGGSVEFAAGTVERFLPQWWGAVADFDGSTGTDNAAAFQAFLDAGGSAADEIGSRHFIPRGRYYFASSLFIRRRLVLEGASSAPGASAGADLIFEDGVTGLVIDRFNTSADGGSGDWCTLRHFQVRGTGTSVAGADGIRAHARFSAYNIHTRLFSQHGVNITAGSGHGPSGESTNANTCKLLDCRSSHNGGNGFHFQGGDANACNVIGCDSSSNTGWGFDDSSFLGNYFFGCHTSANGSGAYRSTSNNSTGGFVLCYSEAGQPPSDIIAPSMVWGGTHGAGFTATTTANRTEGTTSGAAMVGRLVAHNDVIQTTMLQSGPGTGKLGPLMRILDAAGSWAWRGDFGNTGLWALYYTATGSVAFNLWDERNIRGVDAGMLSFPNGYLHQSGNVFVHHKIGTTAPVSGTWRQGDVVWNRTPGKDGNNMIIQGWICTAAGTPGTWEPMYVSTVSPAT